MKLALESSFHHGLFYFSLVSQYLTQGTGHKKMELNPQETKKTKQTKYNHILGLPEQKTLDFVTTALKYYMTVY